MKEGPILMHARSINGILENRKSQTRRIVKVPRYIDASPEPYGGIEECDCQAAAYPHLVGIGTVSGCQVCINCPYGQPGDRLWVREAFAKEYVGPGGQALYARYRDGLSLLQGRHETEVIDWTDDVRKWKPSIHMPRWASRLTLEITGIRVERVQDISAADCISEGIDYKKHRCGCEFCSMTSTICAATCSSLAMEFASLWNDTNGKGAWDRNDWCWVVDFRRIEA